MFKSKTIRLLMWALALLLTGWTLVNLPLASIKQSVSSLSWTQWFAWCGINLAIVSLGTKRWSGLIYALGAKISFARLLFIRQAGQAISFITPGPQFGGEPLQVFWLSRNGISLEKSILSIGLDRCYELLTNFTVLLLCVFVLIKAGNSSFIEARISSKSIFNNLVILTIVLAVLWIFLRRVERISKVFRRLFSRWTEHQLLKKMKDSWRLIYKDFGVVVRTRKLALVEAAVVSFLGWAALLGELALLLQFLQVDFDITAFLLILVAMRLALLLPIPGGVGTLEASVFWSFHYLHLPGSAAIGLIALMRLRDILILLCGLYCVRIINQKSVPAQASPSF